MSEKKVAYVKRVLEEGCFVSRPIYEIETHPTKGRIFHLSKWRLGDNYSEKELVFDEREAIDICHRALSKSVIEAKKKRDSFAKERIPKIKLIWKNFISIFDQNWWFLLKRRE